MNLTNITEKKPVKLRRRKKAAADEAINILLVDDREDNLLSMEIVLEAEGYRFTKALSGREALKILLKNEDFSLILMDVKMPIMDGYETAELIYQREKLRHIPIIFITGQDYEEAAVFKGYETGAVDYIRKPFNPQLLRSKVAVFAELHRKNKLLQRQEEKLRLINEDLMALNRSLEARVKERTTELEKMNGELKALNHSKDKFLSVISHDLRNPLTALIASSEKLNQDFNSYPEEKIRQLTGIISRTSVKILDQLNELVEWAKKQQEKTNFNPKRIQLLKKMNDSLELLQANASQKEITLEYTVEEDVFVYADAAMLRSILQNLVANAIKYTPQGGSVRITARSLSGFVEVCVEDTGVGMTADVKERLFSQENSSSALGTNKEQG